MEARLLGSGPVPQEDASRGSEGRLQGNRLQLQSPHPERPIWAGEDSGRQKLSCFLLLLHSDHPVAATGVPQGMGRDWVCRGATLATSLRQTGRKVRSGGIKSHQIQHSILVWWDTGPGLALVGQYLPHHSGWALPPHELAHIWALGDDSCPQSSADCFLGYGVLRCGQGPGCPGACHLASQCSQPRAGELCRGTK